MNADYIDPRALAEKLQTSGFLESLMYGTKIAPNSLRELLWFAQDRSGKPGGLETLFAGIVSDYMPAYELAGKEKGYWCVDSPKNIPASFRHLCAPTPPPDDDYWTSGNRQNIIDLLGAHQWTMLFASLLELMERHAVDTLKTIAQTEVTKTIFRELEFSRRKGVPVPIIGESRIGKTKPASVWCAARPGRARLVDVPDSNRERDFVTSHADAFGIPYTNRTTTQSLRSDVQYVNQHSHLFLCYDESQFLVPSNYTKTTVPRRLNWVRRQVVDRDRGCGLIATPQSYHQTLDQYVKITGYNIGQWLGRITNPVVLPADLGREDLLAVAKIHFPEMPMPFLKLIAARAMRSEGYLKHLEMTAKRAEFLAEEDGRDQVRLEDVQNAIAQIMPETVAQLPGRDELVPPAPAPSPRRTPVRQAQDFSDRSLTDNLPRKGGIEAHLTPA